MIPMQLKPYKKFYKVDIRDLKEYEKTSTWSLISKIWHVSVSMMSSSPYLKCQIETFRRTQDDSSIEQSEKILWSRLAMINDDVSFLLDSSGQPLEIINYGDLKKKLHETLVFIRERFEGDLIEKLLAEVETIYNDESSLLSELNEYKHFGLLIHDLYNNDLNKSIRPKTFKATEEDNISMEEYFTEKESKDAFIRFDMEGKVTNIEKNKPMIDSYNGIFTFETENRAIHKASVNIEYSLPEYKNVRHYSLQALSAKDMQYT